VLALIVYRPFRNTDPHALAEIWRSQPRLQRLAQPMSAGQLEQHVFSKTYFDPAGLIVAAEGARPVGFVHAGFGPTADGSCLDTTRGVIARLFAIPSQNRGAILVELLAAAEDYLRRQGAQQAFIGNASGTAADGFGPYYLGFYGSACLPGVLRSDADTIAFFEEAGYAASTEQVLLQRSLVGFRPPVDRDQVRLRKTWETKTRYDPATARWWEAVTTSCLERMQCEVVAKTGGEPIASATTWHMQPLCSSWGLRAAGFETILATENAWLDGTAMLLIADTMKALLCDGVTLCEAVVEHLETPAARLFCCLGFTEVDRGISLSKAL
jgi:hypothetical protein